MPSARIIGQLSLTETDGHSDWSSTTSDTGNWIASRQEVVISQRIYRSSPPKQMLFVSTVRNGKPCPSLLQSQQVRNLPPLGRFWSNAIESGSIDWKLMWLLKDGHSPSFVNHISSQPYPVYCSVQQLWGYWCRWRFSTVETGSHRNSLCIFTVQYPLHTTVLQYCRCSCLLPTVHCTWETDRCFVIQFCIQLR